MNNKNNKTEKFGDSELGKGIGLALVILAICIGFGGCYKLVQSAENESLKIRNETSEIK